MLFGVGSSPKVIPTGGNRLPEPGGLFLRWLDVSALMILIGALAVSGRVFASMGPGGSVPRRRAYRLAFAAAGTAALTGPVIAFLRVPHDGRSFRDWFDATWATMGGTPWGRLWTAREVTLIVLVVVLGANVRRHTDLEGPPRMTALTALAAAVGFEALAGHAFTLPRQSGLAAAASGAHLVAAGVWAGGLVVLVLCLGPRMRRDPDARGPILATAWRSFSPMAAVAAVVLVATGLYESGRHLPDLRSLGSTIYGNAVVVKVVVVVVALGLAGFNTMLVNPGLAERLGSLRRRAPGWSPVSLRRFTTVVTIEAGFLIVAVVAAALLTSVPTARDIEAAATETAPVSANVDGLFITFEAVPAGTQQSRLIVRTRSTVKPEPGPIAGTIVALTDPDRVESLVALDEIEPGRYEAEIPSMSPGGWVASVVVRRAGAADAVEQFEWVVPESTPADAQPLEVVLTTVAVLMVAALAVAIRSIRRTAHQDIEVIHHVHERIGRPQ